jgi:hypothetical protein
MSDDPSQSGAALPRRLEFERLARTNALERVLLALELENRAGLPGRGALPRQGSRSPVGR